MIARLFALLAISFTASAQFEVASVKPSGPVQSSSTGMMTKKGFLSANELTLKRYIMGAYGLGQNEVVGGPEWVSADRFHIVARAEKPVGDTDLMGLLRGLLADRFKLVVHKETRTSQAYILTLAKGGLKLEKSPEGEASTSSSRGRIEAKATTLRAFAERLGRQMDYPVIDRTGVEGIYNFSVEWSPEENKPDNRPSIFTALQQLGLRLTTEKAPVEMLVIDHAERPSEN